MTELELYKFITNNNIEYHRSDGEIYFFINHNLIGNFLSILSPDFFDDEGYECWMKNGYFVFTASHLCNYYDIAVANVFSDPSR